MSGPRSSGEKRDEEPGLLWGALGGGGAGAEAAEVIAALLETDGEALGASRDAAGGASTSTPSHVGPTWQYPATLLEAQTIVQLREEAEERRQKKGGGGHGKDKGAGATPAAIIDPKTKKGAYPWDKKDKNAFWLFVEDYFRDIEKVDIDRCLAPYIGDLTHDPALSVPAVGPNYTETWSREDVDVLVTHQRLVAGQQKLAASRKKVAQSSPSMRRQRAANPRLVAMQQVWPNQSSEPVEELCHVCLNGESFPDDEILFCDNPSCNIAVHQGCYGVKKVPEGNWYCRTCEQDVARGKVGCPPSEVCVLCLKTGGAMKPMDLTHPDGSTMWAHSFCISWIPELYYDNESSMEPGRGTAKALKDRKSLVCSICRKPGGCCIQCAHGNCAVAFHVMCAKQANRLMLITQKEGSDVQEYQAFCHEHGKKNSARARLDMDRCPVAVDNNNNIGAEAGKEDGKEALDGKQGRHPSSSSAQVEKTAVVEQAANAAVEANATPEKKPDDDLLESCGLPNVAVILRQLVAVGATTEQLISEAVGFSERELRPFLQGVDKPLVFDAVKGWLKGSIDFVKSVQGDPSQEDERSALGAAALKNALFGDLPAKDDPATTEIVHPYIEHMLKKPHVRRRQTALVIEEEADKVGGDAASNAASDKPDEIRVTEAAAATNAERPGGGGHESADVEEGRNVASGVGVGDTRSQSDGLGDEDFDQPSLAEQKATLESNAQLLALAPGDEILAELLYLQTELAQVVADNRVTGIEIANNFFSRVDEMKATRETWTTRAKDIEKYLFTQRESRRALKREKRALEQQAAIQRAAKAAAKTSRFGHVGRNAISQLPRLFFSGITQPLKAGSAQAADGEDLCCVCFGHESTPSNQIVFCERCGIGVHQKCYSVGKLPSTDWLCHPCREYELYHPGTRPPRWARTNEALPNGAQCVLCPHQFGAMKKDIKTSEWVHVCCSLWHQEIASKDLTAANSIEGVDAIDELRKGLECVVCSKTEGACITCCHTDENGLRCTKSFHPLCGVRNAFEMYVTEDSAGCLSYRQYCEEHTPEGRDKRASILFREAEEGILVHKPSTKLHPGLSFDDFHRGKITPAIRVSARSAAEDIDILKNIRMDLQRLLAMSDRTVQRERIKAEITRCSGELVLARLRDPQAALALASSVAVKGNNTNAMMALGNGAGKRKAGGEGGGGGALLSQERGGMSKRSRRSGSGKASEKECMMTSGEADATNYKLPQGYMYVPADVLGGMDFGGRGGGGS